VRDAEDALHYLDGTRLHGRELEIQYAEGDRKSQLMKPEKGKKMKVIFYFLLLMNSSTADEGQGAWSAIQRLQVYHGILMCLYCDVDTQPRFCFVFLQGASVSKSTPLQKRRKVFKEPQSEASKIKKSLLVSHLDTIILIVCVIRSFSTTAMCIHSGRHRSRSFSRSWSRSRSRSPTPRHSRRGGHRDHRDAVSRSRSRSFSR